MTGKISANFSWEEFERSQIAAGLGLDNSIPDERTRENIRSLVTAILQPLRTAYGKPLVINSGYRCKQLNDLLGGSKASQHMSGQAADVASGNPIGLARKVIALGLDFDQLILYPTFVHLSHTTQRKNHRQVLYDRSWVGPKL